MPGPKQTTLFRSWGNQANTSQPAAKLPESRPAAAPSGQQGGGPAFNEDVFADDDEDEILARVLQESLKDAQRAGYATESSTEDGNRTSHTVLPPAHPSVSHASSSAAVPSTSTANPSSSKQQWGALFKQVGKPGSSSTSNLPAAKTTAAAPKRGRPVKAAPAQPPAPHIVTTEDVSEDQLPDPASLEDLPGLDKASCRLWIYPTNYPMRSYQHQIVYQGLLQNTLVVLPTGLGKTFIAAVVMYNFYRWYPCGKVVFMAPTKPLVAQQIQACYNIMGIPQSHTAEMTGTMQPADRKRAWQNCRVFFLTPQTMNNDLARGACPAVAVKCLVVDEAHKALGNHAYCQVVRELGKQTQDFRVLALSATPGGDIKTVQQVVSNLLIAHIEARSDESPDIQQYQHERRVDKIVVPLGQELTAIRDKYLRILDIPVSKLKRQGVLYGRDTKSLSKFMILKAREAFRQNPPPQMQPQQFGIVEGDLALCMSLYHGYELIQQHGLRALFSYLESLVNGDKGYGRVRAELLKNAELCELMDMLRENFQPIRSALPSTQQSRGSTQQPKRDLAFGHPKLVKLQEIVLEHFNSFQQHDANGVATRVMIFSQLRDSVNEITEVLDQHRPLVKVMSFVGQSLGKSSKGFTQADQLKVMRKFREGGFNTLVSTCVGEEGLDIGEVDLIICFDASKSPIRLIQRMGRTGRKRSGRIVMMMAEGKEEQMYNQSLVAKRSIYRTIENGKSLNFYGHSQRLLPAGLDPVCHKMHITVTQQFQAKPDRTAARTAAPGPSRPAAKTSATKAPTRKKSEVGSDGLLTPEQLEYWSKHYKVDTTPAMLAEPQCLSLKRKSNVRARDSLAAAAAEPLTSREHLSVKTTAVLSPEYSGKPKSISYLLVPCRHSSPGHQQVASPARTQPELDLSAWTPWQNRLQSCHLVEHSMETRHLVELMEFMEMQGACETAAESYDHEMSQFLNTEDVNLSPKMQGIRRYTTPIADNSKPDMRTEDNKGKKVRGARHTIELEPIECDETSRSDEDLPEVQHLMTSDDITPAPEQRQQEDVHCPSPGEEQANTRTNKPSTTKSTHENRLEYPLRQKDREPGNSNRVNNMLTRKKKVRKKKQNVERNVSMITVIDASEDEDFEGVVATEKDEDSDAEKMDCDGDDESNRDGGSTSSHQRGRQPSGHDEPKTLDIEMDIENTAVMEAHHDQVAPSTNTDVFPVAGQPCGMSNSTLSQMLPIFTPQKVPLHTQQASPALGWVSTPPLQAELDSALRDLDDRQALSPIDLLSLVDQWEQEKTRGDHTGSLDDAHRRSLSFESVSGHTDGQHVPHTAVNSDEGSCHPGWKSSVPYKDVEIVGAGDRQCSAQRLATVKAALRQDTNAADMSWTNSQFCLALDEDEFDDVFVAASQHSAPASVTEEPFWSYCDSMDEAHMVSVVNHVETSTEDKSGPHTLSSDHILTADSEHKSGPDTSSAKPKPGSDSIENLIHDSKENNAIPVSVSSDNLLHLSSSSTGSPRPDLGHRIGQDTTRDCTIFSPAPPPRGLAPTSTSTPCLPPMLKRPSDSSHPIHTPKMNHVSFFDDGEDTDLLEAVDGGAKPDSRQHSPVRSAGGGDQESPVLTFTQAMACLHSSMDSSLLLTQPARNRSVVDVSIRGHENATAGSPSPRPGESTSWNRDKVNDYHKHSPTSDTVLGNRPETSNSGHGWKNGIHVQHAEPSKYASSSAVTKPSVPQSEETIDNMPTKNSPVKSESPVDKLDVDEDGWDLSIEAPQFDLGFDLEDLEDEIIAPSPPKPSSQQLLSQRILARSRLSSRASSPTMKPVQIVAEQDTIPTNKMLMKQEDEKVDSQGFGSDHDLDGIDFALMEDINTVPDTEMLDIHSPVHSPPLLHPNLEEDQPKLTDVEMLDVHLPVHSPPLVDSHTEVDHPYLSPREMEDTEPSSQSILPQHPHALSPPVQNPSSKQSSKVDDQRSRILASSVRSSAPRSLSATYQTENNGMPLTKPVNKLRRKKPVGSFVEKSVSLAERVGHISRYDSDASHLAVLTSYKSVGTDSSMDSNGVCHGWSADVSEDGAGRRKTSSSTTSEKSPDFKTPVKPAPKRSKKSKVLISSDEESPLKLPPKCVKAVSFSENIDDGFSDEDDFLTSGGVSPPHRSGGNDVQRTKVKKKKKRNHGGRQFLEVEAELSGDSGSSDDAEDSDLDLLDASFINDGTEMSQRVNDSVDMHAVYLQSVHGSPLAGPSRYKLQYEARHMDVFSQVPRQDSEYLEDSFCVPSGEESQHSGSESDGEVTVNEKSLIYGVRTRRARRFAAARTGRPPARSMKRRVVQIQDSSSEDEAGRHALEQTVLQQRGKPRKICDNSSEEEIHPAAPRAKARKLVENSSSSSENEEWSSFMESLHSGSPSQVTSPNAELPVRASQRPTGVVNNGVQKESQRLQSSSQNNLVVSKHSIQPAGINQKAKESVINGRTSGYLKDEGPGRPVLTAQQKAGTSASSVLSECDNEMVDILIDSQGFTQRPSLASRIKNRISGVTLNSICGPGQLAGRAVKAEVEQEAMFVLDSDSDFDSTVPEPSQYSESLLSPQNKQIIPHGRLNSNMNADDSHHIISGNHKIVPPCDNDMLGNTENIRPKDASELRAERLRLSRLKQEEFKRKLAAQKEVNTASTRAPEVNAATTRAAEQRMNGTLNTTLANQSTAALNTTHHTRILQFASPFNAALGTSVSSECAIDAQEDNLRHGILSSVTAYSIRNQNKLVIFMDSREINGAQDLVSCLRSDHQVDVAVRQLSVCGYLVSNRMGVERKYQTDFSCGSQRARLMERLRAMTEHLDRQCLIVEQERLKKDEKPKKTTIRTKYVDKLVSSLCQTPVKILYSSSQEETARLLAELAQQEQRKGMAVNVPYNLTTPQEMVLSFYLSLPRINYATALNFLHNYKTIKDFMVSSAGAISRRGQISEQRAERLHGYLQHQFDAQMLAYQK